MPRKKREAATLAPPDPQLEAVLARIRDARNFDFRNYKRATLRRRIERRMGERGCDSISGYIGVLDSDPTEYDALIGSMLIKVTSFFRDPEPWETLSGRVIPQLLAEKRPGEEIRVWCAGCATGEEAFTVAMLFADALGPAFYNAELKVFGTDVDERAIAFARHGIYSRDQVAAAPQKLRERWFVEEGGGWQVRKEVRRAVVFGVNNLVSDAPISRLDLLLCRNVFIYLDAALQKRVLTRFHYALRRNGLLMLGKSELIPFAARLFEPVDLVRRIYRKNGGHDSVVGHERLLNVLEGGSTDRDGRERVEVTVTEQFHHQVLEAVASAIIATDVTGTVLAWNGAAASLWGRPEGDVVGKKLAALNLPGLAGELLIEQSSAVREGRSQSERSPGTVTRASDSRLTQLEVEVTPLHSTGNEVNGLVYTARDITSVRELELELRKSTADRQNVYEELQTINEEMQSSNEELETTNEELQSANEELQTTNEELQSTNEELETTNEELQSTNAELDATNRELAARTEEINTLAYFQRTIIRSLGSAVVVLDEKGRVKVWNLAAERLLGLSEEEAQGQALWTLHVPALPRPMLSRVRKSVAQNQPVRNEQVEYLLPNGTKGNGTLAAVPIVEAGEAIGSVIIFEDTTRLTALAAEVARAKAEHGRKRRR